MEVRGQLIYSYLCADHSMMGNPSKLVKTHTCDLVGMWIVRHQRERWPFDSASPCLAHWESEQFVYLLKPLKVLFLYWNRIQSSFPGCKTFIRAVSMARTIPLLLICPHGLLSLLINPHPFPSCPPPSFLALKAQRNRGLGSTPIAHHTCVRDPHSPGALYFIFSFCFSVRSLI